MKFLSIRIQNFFSIRKLKLSLEDRGAILITGRNMDNPAANSNGSGKSSIWDALIWCLYGRVVREDVGADDILNNKTKGGCTVSVRIKDDDGAVWVLTRTRGVKSSPSLDLYCDGSTRSSSTSIATQEAITSLVGADLITFSSSVVFGQDSLRFARLTDKEKKTVLERLLGLDLYEKAYKLACAKVSAQKMTLELQKANWLHLHEQLKEARIKLKEYEEKNKHEKQVIQETLEKLKKSLRERKGEHAKIAEQVRQSELREEKLRGLQDEKREAQAESARSKSLHEEYCEEAAGAVSQLDGLLHDKGACCPTCGQSVSGSSRKSTMDKLREIVKDRNAKAETAFRRYRRYRKIARRLQRRLEKSGGPTNLLQLRADLSRTGEIISSIRATLNHTRANGPVSTQILAETAKQVKDLELRAKSEDESIQKDKRLLERRRYWQNGFSPAGIRSFILDGIVPFLDERANRYAEILTDGRIRIHFSTVTKLKNGEYKEKFAVQATNTDGANIYGGNSAGERQRIDLCVALALKDLARSRSKKNLDLMVFDEAFESLDEAGSERVIALLQEERNNFKSCFVISHTDALKQYFTERVEVVKRNGHSRLETHV
jgi:DNA repair exonuclease SbcCD ATPase subunit